MASRAAARETHRHAGEDETAAFGRAFALGAALNLVFVTIEAGFGIVSNSVALLADAGHNLSDVLGLAIAWGASILVRRRPTYRYTYGLRSTSILAALFNAIVLLIAVGAIILEAVNRLAAPRPVATGIVIAVAAAGIAVNAVTALLLARGHHHHSHTHDLNLRAAIVHMVADAGVSLGVVLSGIGILLTGWLWLDPAASFIVAFVIVAGTWRLLRDAINMALHAVPAEIDPAAVREHLAGLKGVCAVHDLHIWPMSTTETALTCHLVIPDGHPGDRALAEISTGLHDRFGIEHATIQVETGDPDHPCRLGADHVV